MINMDEKTDISLASGDKTGGKRICIQDADGKIFFLQCPEGFVGGDNEESAVPLAAWVSSNKKKTQLTSSKKTNAVVSNNKPKKLHLRTSVDSGIDRQSKLIVPRKTIEYETGYDPITGEVKGPDIDPSVFLSTNFNESAAVRDVNSTDDLNKAWFTTSKDKEALLDKGVVWKQGAWSQEEVSTLTENIKDYCLARGIEDPAHVIFNMSKEERNDFYPTIAKGLQRPLFAVYRRVKRDYDVNNHKGVYTASEVEILKNLLSKHGPDWKLIGEKLGRSAQSVKDRSRQFKDIDLKTNNGKWTGEEEKRLVMAVHEVGKPSSNSLQNAQSTSVNETQVKTENVVVTAGKWREVASLVRTRNEKQCRKKWTEVVKASITVGPVAPATATTVQVPADITAEWGMAEDAHLINTLNKVMNCSVTHSQNPITTASLHNSHRQPHIPQTLTFKASSLEVADFAHMGSTVERKILPTEPSTSILTSVTHPTATLIPGHVTATAHGLVATTLHSHHMPAPLQPLQPHMPEVSGYIWPHHTL